MGEMVTPWEIVYTFSLSCWESEEKIGTKLYTKYDAGARWRLA